MIENRNVLGSKSSFAVEYQILDIVVNDDGIYPYGKICLWFDGEKFGSFHQEDMLGYFYVNCETIIENFSQLFNDPYLIEIGPSELLRLWKEFRSIKSIDDPISADAEKFNDHYFFVRAPFNSLSFNQWNIIFYKNAERSLIGRIWKNSINAGEVIDLIIKIEEFLSPLNEFIQDFDQIILENSSP